MSCKKTIYFSLLIILLISSEKSSAQPGQLDPGFGQNGIVTTAFSDSNSLSLSMSIQNDGKIIAAGSVDNGNNNDFIIVRYNPDGSPDNTFGSNGIVATEIGSMDDYINSIVIQDDGKIVAAGYSDNGSDFDFALARYNIDGSLDNTFGTNGIVITPVGSSNDYAYSVALQGDGKIIAAGTSFSSSSNRNFALVRYNTNGDIDSSFGMNGILISAISFETDIAYSVLIQFAGSAEEKILAAGYTFAGSLSDFVIERFNLDGSADDTFGTSGRVLTEFGTANGVARSIALQSDGKIIAAGFIYEGFDYDYALVRYDENGKIDSSFGMNGKVIAEIGDFGNGAYSVAVQSVNGDEKIIAAGYSSPSGGTTDFAIARFNSDGNPDNSFGVNGYVINSIGNFSDYINSVAMQSDGKIVAAGYSTYDNNYTVISLARYIGEGTTDVKFIEDIPESFILHQNYPNPFNPVTKIKFTIPNVETRHASSLLVKLIVYDALGKEVATLVNEEKPAGEYEVEFNASQLSSGIYFYKLNAGSFSETRKMIFLK